MPNEYYRPRSFKDGDEFYLITYNPKGEAVYVDPVEHYDRTLHESDSSDSDAEKPCVTKARADGLRKRKAARRARRARRDEAKRQRDETTAEDVRLLNLLRQSLETVELARELLEQQKREAAEGPIRRETNPREWERQMAFHETIRERFQGLQIPAIWDELDGPAETEAAPIAEEVAEEAAEETPLSILEREDIGVLFEGREDIWVPSDD